MAYYTYKFYFQFLLGLFVPVLCMEENYEIRLSIPSRIIPYTLTMFITNGNAFNSF
ncbi:hypothetical protein J5U23_01667 [Saccharolobus shibatae B12]|uniref:Uncharacterized protein n=1 Tax=Saccharolobus shibatae (strain ATCC 51178 / DSM 5389 / JCM 8931 / NBRC 15437 / B12) TaxID=523848 RepID=A0A8F5GTC6_SACSH|nr:hypothetical protein J5U23_01667 [Saccharolobus shibatae B12]